MISPLLFTGVRLYEAVIGYILTGVMIAIFNVIIFLIPIYIFFRTTLVSLPLLLVFTVGLGIIILSNRLLRWYIL